jgi:heat shock protein HslJ
MKPHYVQFIIWYPIILVTLVACGMSGVLSDSPSLAGKPDAIWLLHSYGPQDSQTPAVPDSKVTLKFDFDENIAGGNAGCNMYSGSFTLKGDKLSFGQLMSTLMACFPDELMQQETTFTGLLGQVTHYELTEDTLILYTSDGQVLTFTETVLP